MGRGLDPLDLTVTFAKLQAARWLGHQDLLRAFERALRRAALPAAYTEGFNPRAKLTFASALGVGTTGFAEIVVIGFTEQVDPALVLQDLNQALPPGIRVLTAEPVPAGTHARAVITPLNLADMSAMYLIEPPVGRDAVDNAVAAIADRDTLLVTRHHTGRSQIMDLGSLLHGLKVQAYDNGRLCLTYTTSISNNGSVRPSDLTLLLQPMLPGIALLGAQRERIYATATTSQS